LNVSEALESRFTCRAFLPDPVVPSTVRSLLEAARRTPSGGNLQPWWVWALTGEKLKALTSIATAEVAAGRLLADPVEYVIYPPEKEPYSGRRFRTGEAMYEAIGLARDDWRGRMQQTSRNFEFFGAPVGLFIAIDRTMLPPQWADLGMFLQSLMLLAREHGLHSAPIEAWSFQHRTVRDFLGMPEDLMLWCGLALGHADPADPINDFRAERASLEEFATLVGFT